MSQSHNDRSKESVTLGKVPAHAVGQSGWWLNSLRRVAARKFSNPIIENLALFACLVAVELYLLKLGLKAFILSLKVRYLILKSRYLILKSRYLSFGKREAIKRKIEAFALYIRQRYFRKDLSCGVQDAHVDAPVVTLLPNDPDQTAAAPDQPSLPDETGGSSASDCSGV